MSYRPRTQSKKFLDGDCPSGVLAIYDNGGKTFDRYTVYYKPVVDWGTGSTWIDYRAMSEDPCSPQGFGIYSQDPAHQVAAYRSSIYRQSAKWSELPEAVKELVRRDCADLDELAKA